jgi:hypothetical protein
MSKIIGTIQGCDVIEGDDGSVHFLADADIDCDGGSNPHHDPCWQPDTSLHFDGRAIDAESVPYIVVPPLIRDGVSGIVLGCIARVTNSRTGQSTEAVVGDIGPHKKIGEISSECARRIGVNDNPNTGGEEDHVISYTLWPGSPAVVDGVTYELQRA